MIRAWYSGKRLCGVCNELEIIFCQATRPVQKLALLDCDPTGRERTGPRYPFLAPSEKLAARGSFQSTSWGALASTVSTECGSTSWETPAAWLSLVCGRDYGSLFHLFFFLNYTNKNILIVREGKPLKYSLRAYIIPSLSFLFGCLVGFFFFFWFLLMSWYPYRIFGMTKRWQGVRAKRGKSWEGGHWGKDAGAVAMCGLNKLSAL